MMRFAFFCLILALSACKPSPPPPPAEGLSDEQFIAVMIDVQLSEGMRTQRSTKDINDGVDASEMYHDIFEKHEVSKDAFFLTYNYYKENPAGMELIYEAVLDSLSKLEAEIKQSYTNMQKAERDSIDMAKRKNFEKKRGIVLPE